MQAKAKLLFSYNTNMERGIRQTDRLHEFQVADEDDDDPG